MKSVGVHQRHRVNMWGQTELIKVLFPVPRCKPGTNLSWGSRRGSGGGAGAILQGEVSDEDNELGKCPTDLSARALEQVLREPVRISKQNVVCKPVAYILTVSQQDAKGIIPRGENKINMCKQGQEHLRGKKKGKKKQQGSPVTGRTPYYFLGVKTCAEEKPSCQLSTYHSNLLCLWQKVVLS